MTPSSANNANLNGPVEPDTPTPRRTRGQRLVAVGLVLVIVIGGLYTARLILRSKPKPSRKPPVKAKVLVQVEQATREDIHQDIRTLGTVLSARELSLKPAVSGTVHYVNPELVPGGTLNKGDLLIELDPRDYQLSYERSRNNLEKAAMDLRLEEGNQVVARREYQFIKEYAEVDLQKAPMDLALREPQLIKAKAEKAAAETEMKTARLNLERTRLHAPFNCVVLEKNVEIGAQISSQTTVARLAGTDVYWIRVSLPVDELAKIELPADGREGATVRVSNLHLDSDRFRRGKLIRLLPDVDPQGLMARVLVEVENPVGTADLPPLLLGSIVKVSLEGRILEGIYQVPRSAVLQDRTILVAGPDNTLDIRPVTVAGYNEDTAYIANGLKDGDRVIVSSLSAPIQGMELTVQSLTQPGD